MKAQLRHYYRSYLPQPVRAWWESWYRYLPWRLSPRRLWSALHWMMSSPETIAEETDRRLGVDPYFWLFVLGVNNSGTTLLVRLLEAHPLIRTLRREGQYLTRSLPHPRDFGIRRLWATRLEQFRMTEDSPDEPALRTRYDWSLYYPRRPGILLEKSPTNTVRAPWLQKHFRPCRFLAIIRDPYAVCEGVRRREGHSIEDAATHWARANSCLLEDGPRLQHYLLIRYEDLCTDPQSELKRIEDFLELPTPFDAGIVSKDFELHTLETPGSAIQSFNAKSLARLSADDIAAISKIAGPVMERFGYACLTSAQV